MQAERNALESQAEFLVQFASAPEEPYGGARAAGGEGAQPFEVPTEPELSDTLSAILQVRADVQLERGDLGHVDHGL